MRRLVPVVALLTTAALLFSSVTPAAACSCAPRTIEANVDHYDAVVVGTITEVFSATEPSGFSGRPDDIDARVRVETYYKGFGPANIVVDDPIGGGDCGFISESSVGQRYLFFLTTESAFGGIGQADDLTPRFFTHLCAGNVVLDGEFYDVEPTTEEHLADLQSITGPGQPPTADTPVELNYGEQFFGTDVDSDNPPNALMWLAAAAVPLAFLAAATIAPWRRP